MPSHEGTVLGTVPSRILVRILVLYLYTCSLLYSGCLSSSMWITDQYLLWSCRAITSLLINEKRLHDHCTEHRFFFLSCACGRQQLYKIYDVRYVCARITESCPASSHRGLISKTLTVTPMSGPVVTPRRHRARDTERSGPSSPVHRMTQSTTTA